jgi:hypothetical protein
MSGTRIQAVIHTGEAIAAQLRERREDYLAVREVRARQALDATALHLTAATAVEQQLIELTARGKALTFAPAGLTEVMSRAHRAPVVEQVVALREAVVAAEVADERMVMRRERQAVVFEQLVAHLPADLTATVTANDGRMSAQVQVEGGGHFTVSLDEACTVELDMQEGLVEEYATDDGVVIGCDAERAVAERVRAHWRAAGIEVFDDTFDDIAVRTVKAAEAGA